MFVYVYTVAANNQLDDDDDDDYFMKSLQDSLRAFKKRKAVVVETANTLFTFDNDVENIKVCNANTT
jgi:hypothetical protein